MSADSYERFTARTLVETFDKRSGLRVGCNVYEVGDCITNYDRGLQEVRSKIVDPSTPEPSPSVASADLVCITGRRAANTVPMDVVVPAADVDTVSIGNLATSGDKAFIYFIPRYPDAYIASSNLKVSHESYMPNMLFQADFTGTTSLETEVRVSVPGATRTYQVTLSTT